jgi:hypothetical protein
VPGCARSSARTHPVLGLEVGPEWGLFLPVATANGVTLDYAAIPAESIVMQHYAFLVSDEEFDAALARIQQAGLGYYADPHIKQPGEINHHHGGRGFTVLMPSRCRAVPRTPRALA